MISSVLSILFCLYLEVFKIAILVLGLRGDLYDEMLSLCGDIILYVENVSMWRLSLCGDGGYQTSSMLREPLCGGDLYVEV